MALIPSVVSIGFALYGIHEIRNSKRMVQEIVPSLDDYIFQDDAGEWHVEERLAKVFDLVGSRMAQSIRMSFLQGLGAQRKIEKGLKGALAKDIVEKKMPLLNLAGEFLGFNTQEYLGKHPEAIGQLLQLAGPLLGQVQHGNPRSSQGGTAL